MHVATMTVDPTPPPVATVRRSRRRIAAPRTTRDRDFERFFVEAESELLHFCWGLTLDRELARDVAQEAMARAWRDWDAISSGNPAGWLRTVALNLVRTRWRSGRRGDAAVLRLAVRDRDDGVELPPPVRHEVRAALAELPERQREAVVLHHLLDLPVAQVAELMGIGEPATKTHLQRGRAALHALLAEAPGGADHD